MNVAATILGAALCVAPAPGEAEPTSADGPPAPPDGTDTASQIDVLILETVGFERDAFTSELQLRLPSRTIVGVNSPRPERGYVYVHVTREPPDAVRISVVETDGRAYDRRLPHEPDQEIRVATSAVATLLASVESGDVVPDRRDAPIPEPAPPPVDEPAPPPPTPEPTPAPAAAPPPPPAPPPRLELGPSITGVVGLGVAPLTPAGAFGGAGGSLGLWVRHRAGPLAVLEARALHDPDDALASNRLRVSVGGGYDWRWPHFELPVWGAIAVEPWWIRRAGRSPDLQYEGSSTGRRPLLGALVGTAPGYFWRSPQRPSVAVRAGPHLTLSGSFVPHRGARTVRIDVIDAAGDTTPAARLGGFEVEAGLGVTVWFAVRPAGGQSSQ